MKKHFKTLFDAAHLMRTSIMIALGIVFLIGAGIVGISDNAPGIALFYAGTIMLIISMIYVWKEPKSYLLFSAICAGIIALTFILIFIWAKFILTPDPPNQHGHQGEGWPEAVIFILTLFLCLPGIFVGFIGAIVSSIKKK